MVSFMGSLLSTFMVGSTFIDFIRCRISRKFIIYYAFSSARTAPPLRYSDGRRSCEIDLLREGYCKLGSLRSGSSLAMRASFFVEAGCILRGSNLTLSLFLRRYLFRSIFSYIYAIAQPKTSLLQPVLRSMARRVWLTISSSSSLLAFQSKAIRLRDRRSEMAGVGYCGVRAKMRRSMRGDAALKNEEEPEELARRDYAFSEDRFCNNYSSGSYHISCPSSPHLIDNSEDLLCSRVIGWAGSCTGG